MAERIYDQTVGQLAGVKIVTTGKGIIKRDGTDAFAQVVSYSTTAGVETNLSTEATALQILTAAQSTTTENVAPDTSVIMNGATGLTPKFAVINLTATGDLVALVASRKLRVVDFAFTCSAAQTVTFTSGLGPTPITGAMSFGVNGGVSSPYNPNGKFETALGAKLSMTIAGAGTVAGWLVYIEVP